MNLPKDPVMLLSFVNTQLRDHYPSLDEFSASFGTDKKALVASLDAIGYHYDEALNKFL